ncbi:hypothetical protein [Brevibacillus dissolubilis]|uniref:hypothetical protein n=1 Tax=Brevibacillus dissolubilis TaxID=1844116 RepID=UPI00159BA258|nr:hypothetical protein [Brevibacillus dissolubilis]
MSESRPQCCKDGHHPDLKITSELCLRTTRWVSEAITRVQVVDNEVVPVTEPK